MRKGKNSLGYISKFDEDSLEGNTYKANPELQYMEMKVRFSLKHGDTSKFCIRTVRSDEPLKKLYTRLGYFEDMTWRQVTSIDRKKGISFEKKESDNHKVLSKEFQVFSSFGHFRVNSKEKAKFRVFGAISNGLFYLLWFDPDGKVNH